MDCRSAEALNFPSPLIAPSPQLSLFDPSEFPHRIIHGQCLGLILAITSFGNAPAPYPPASTQFHPGSPNSPRNQQMGRKSSDSLGIFAPGALTVAFISTEGRKRLRVFADG
jgi:hypothetical protein